MSYTPTKDINEISMLIMEGLTNPNIPDHEKQKIEQDIQKIQARIDKYTDMERIIKGLEGLGHSPKVKHRKSRKQRMIKNRSKRSPKRSPKRTSNFRKRNHESPSDLMKKLRLSF